MHACLIVFHRIRYAVNELIALKLISLWCATKVKKFTGQQFSKWRLRPGKESDISLSSVGFIWCHISLPLDRNVLASKVIDDEGSNIHKTELVVSKIFLDLHSWEWINKPREITSRMSSMGDFILFDFIPDRNTHACLLLAARCRGVLPISSVCWVWNENPWHLERASTQWIEPFSAAMWRGSLSFTSRWHKGDVSFSCRRISKI